MNAFRELLKNWIHEILMRDRDCLATKTGRLKMTSVRKKYFGKASHLAYATLQKLGHGVPGEPDSIKLFATALPLKPVDRAELLIRWGECFINRYAYQVPNQQMSTFIRSWQEMPYQTVHDLQINPMLTLVPPSAGVATGITMYLEVAQLDLKSIKAVPYSTVARFTRTGFAAPRAFNKLINELKPSIPVPNAPLEHVLAYRRKDLTLEKICADYIEAQLGCGRLLRLRLSDLRKSFNPMVHHRLAAWLVRVCLPVQLGSALIEPLYFP
jgi:hypothetical protein